MARHLHGPAADAVEEFLRAIATTPEPRKCAVEMIEEDTVKQYEFVVSADLDLSDPAAMRKEAARFNETIQASNQRLGRHVDVLNSAISDVQDEYENAHGLRSDIADRASRLVRIIDGIGGDGGCLLPFVE